MKYTYLISFSCMLAGCGEPLTLEQTAKAEEYCASKGAAFVMYTNLSMEPVKANCRAKGNYIYEVSLEQMK